MIILNFQREKYVGLLVIICTLAVTLSFIVGTVYAQDLADYINDQLPQAYKIGSQESINELKKFELAVQNAYGLIRNVSVAGAAIGVVTGAFRMFASNFNDKQGEQEVGKGKRQIIYSCLALVVILLLPAVLTMGLEIGKQFGWTLNMS